MARSTLDRTVAGLSRKICKAQLRAHGLTLELAASLGIQDVWPEAFAGGNTCKLCAIETVSTMQDYQRNRAIAAKAGRVYEPDLKKMYLLRADGVRFELTAVQYWALKSIPRGKA